ncbi:hypothetical protein LCGC14_0610670 [marine sediment metagenome]|uniref:Uncharacterized protein n=1 Tax=marine sediment metagenome TaxID=412755 RepID=A0A0F9RRZ5_9ZZZZ
MEDAIRTCENEYNFPKFNYELKRIQEIEKTNLKRIMGRIVDA